MGELLYGDFTERLNRIGIEDVFYTWGPDRFFRADTGDDTIRGDTVPTLGLYRQNQVQPARTGMRWNHYVNASSLTDPNAAATDSYVDIRHNISQVFQLEWGESIASACLRDHLYLLWELNKPFWLMFDDEMSMQCVTLLDVGSERKHFATPTYPVAFYRYADFEGKNTSEYHYIEFFVDGQPIDWAQYPYRFDPTTGLLVFENAIPVNQHVTARYLWRMYCRIKEFQMTPHLFGGTYYKGQIVVQQLVAPWPVERFDDRVSAPPCRDRDGALNDVNELDDALDIDDGLPTPGRCGTFTTAPAEVVTTEITKTCLQFETEHAIGPYSIPAGHWVHGVEITKLLMGVDNGSPDTAVAEVQTRLRLNRTGSTYSDWFAKSLQPSQVVDHAVRNFIDGGSDISWGGRGDLWGKNIGSWTRAMVNSDGLQLNVAWETAANPQEGGAFEPPTLPPGGGIGQWTLTYTYDGNSITEDGCTGETTTPWGSTPQAGVREAWMAGCGTGGVRVAQSGKITLNYEWSGVGDPPKFVDVIVYSRAKARTLTAEANTVLTAVNGLGDAAVVDESGSRLSEGTHLYRLLVDPDTGTAEKEIFVQAEADKSEQLGTGNEVYAGVLVTAGLAPCELPVLEELEVVVHHSPVCESTARCYQEATPGGTWSELSSLGRNCLTAVSSDGAQTGDFDLLMEEFGFEALGANSRIVGFKVTGQYRTVGGGVRIDNLTLKAHVGNYNSGRTGKTLAYPTSDNWVDFEVGTNGDLWDYADTDAETGAEYPTATGTLFNAYTALELLGSNQNGVVYEFKDVRLSVFYFDVGDGL